MVGLIDISPQVEHVDVRATSVEVQGISAKGLAHLLGRFPDLRRLMTGQDVAADQLLAMGGDLDGYDKRFTLPIYMADTLLKPTPALAENVVSSSDTW